MACRPLSFGGLPTTRPSDFPEADLWPASIRCREHANLRPKPNGLCIRDYVAVVSTPTCDLNRTGCASGITCEMAILRQLSLKDESVSAEIETGLEMARQWVVDRKS